jgi:hypothetical protein
MLWKEVMTKTTSPAGTFKIGSARASMLALLLGVPCLGNATPENNKTLAQPSLAASAGQAARSASEPLSKSSVEQIVDSDHVYKPIFLPRAVLFNEAEIYAIRSAASRQVSAYHLASAQENDASGAMWSAQSRQWAAKGEYDRWAFVHTREAFERHATYTQIIFAVVIAIVVSGLVLTWYQFMQDSSDSARLVRELLKRKSSSAKNPEADNAQLIAVLGLLKSEQSIELGKDGMKLQTRVLGLLTLVHVYPVNMKDTQATVQARATNAGLGK